jgi:hypothetical protein
MSQVGSFGVNYKKDFGLDPAVVEFKLGDVASNRLGSFIYIKATAAIDQYAWVGIDENGNATMLLTGGAAEGSVGVVQVALSANEFGFAWIGGAAGGGNGVIKGKVAASYAANAALYTTGVAGVADDAATTLIKNVVGLTTDSGSGSAVALYSSNFLTVK